jgi:hypothetical protein
VDGDQPSTLRVRTRIRSPDVHVVDEHEREILTLGRGEARSLARLLRHAPEGPVVLLDRGTWLSSVSADDRADLASRLAHAADLARIEAERAEAIGR